MLLEVDVNLDWPDFRLAARLTTHSPITGLFGPSGAGKSTLLNLVAGTLRPRRGRIALNGETWFDSRRRIAVPPESRDIALVSRHRETACNGTVRAGLRNAYEAVPLGKRRFRLNQIIEPLELGALLDKPAASLSAGEEQRAALARALLKSPRLLLLDEPLTSVEAGLKTRILRFLRRREGAELPMVYVSHTLSEIFQLTEQFAVMVDGQVARAGHFREIIRDHSLPGVAGLPRIDNILPIRVLSHDLETCCTLAESYGTQLVLPLCTRLAEGSTAQVALRSGDIALSRSYIPGISIQNQLKGRVCAIIHQEDGIMVQVDCGNTLLAGMTLRAQRDLVLREGETVYCLAKAQSFTYLDEPDRAASLQIFSHGDQCFVVGDRLNPSGAAAPFRTLTRTSQ